jgi:tetratricopeptide (TPR) repeat protein
MYLLHFYPYNRGRPALNRMLLPPATIAFVVQNSCFAAIPTGIPAKSFFAEFVIHHRLARHTRQIVAISFFPITAARQLLFLATIATLIFQSVSAESQEAPPAPQSPAQFDSLAARAAGARDQQNLPLAIQLYSQAEQLKPDWQEGWWYLGILQYSANQYAGAIDAFNHLLELAPTAVPPTMTRSAILSRQSHTGHSTSPATNRSFATTLPCCWRTPRAFRSHWTSTASSPNIKRMPPT